MKCKILPEEFKTVFKYDLSSPSNLSWNIDIYCGKNNQIPKVLKGTHCDCLPKNRDRYTVMYKGKNYAVARIVYFLNFPDMDQSMIVDHIDGNATNNSVINLRLVTDTLNSRNVKKRSTVEITGVRFRLVNGYGYWHSRYQSLDGITIEKNFSCHILGNEIAKEKAIDFRNQGIIELNKQGANYTERHGK